MLATLARRAVVRGLDLAVTRGRASRRRPVRLAAGALDRARRLARLDRVPVTIELPPWPEQVPEPPMWESDRAKLARWREQMGYEAPAEGEGAGPDGAPGPGDDASPNAPGAALQSEGAGASHAPAEVSAEPRPEGEVPDSAPRRLPVVGSHPDRSPFEENAGEPVAAAAEPLAGAALVAAVRDVLDACRPMVQADGGDIELLDVRDDEVHLRLSGNCVGCPSAQATLRHGIERRLKAALPQLKGIRAPQLGAL